MTTDQPISGSAGCAPAARQMVTAPRTCRVISPPALFTAHLPCPLRPAGTPRSQMGRGAPPPNNAHVATTKARQQPTKARQPATKRAAGRQRITCSFAAPMLARVHGSYAFN